MSAPLEFDPAKVVTFVPKSFLGDEEIHVRAAPLYRFSPVLREQLFTERIQLDFWANDLREFIILVESASLDSQDWVLARHRAGDFIERVAPIIQHFQCEELISRIKTQIESSPSFEAIASFEQHFEHDAEWDQQVYDELANQVLAEQKWISWVVQESGGALSAYRRCAYGTEMLGQDTHFARQMKGMRSGTVVGVMGALLKKVKLYQ